MVPRTRAPRTRRAGPRQARQLCHRCRFGDGPTSATLAVAGIEPEHFQQLFAVRDVGRMPGDRTSRAGVLDLTVSVLSSVSADQPAVLRVRSRMPCQHRVTPFLVPPSARGQPWRACSPVSWTRPVTVMGSVRADTGRLLASGPYSMTTHVLGGAESRPPTQERFIRRHDGSRPPTPGRPGTTESAATR